MGPRDDIHPKEVIAMDEIDSISERERTFYNEFWARTKIRKIQGTLKIPGVDNLNGKRILICSCGSGKEPVWAANAGAEVFVFDVSPVAVEKAKQVADFNEVCISAQVMNFHHLKYPNEFFDLIYGKDILHHVDCNLAGQQIYRCLKPRGIALFRENSDRNPILRWFRRQAFGIPGGCQKQKFLFFERGGTTDEYPLTDEEVDILSEIFRGNIKIRHDRFVFFSSLSNLGWQTRTFRNLMALLDNFLAKIFPSIVKYSFDQQIWLQKPIN